MTPLEVLNSTPKQRQIWYWRKECESANRHMRIYPQDDPRRKEWEEKFKKAEATLKQLIPEMR